MATRLPTGPTPVAHESTAAGTVQPRPREQSFGQSVLNLVSGIAGEKMPQLSARTRDDTAAIIDAGLGQALAATRSLATSGADSSRWALRLLLGVVLVLAFALVGVLLWSLGARVSEIEATAAEQQEQITEITVQSEKVAEAAAARRELLDANVQLLAAHAVALTENVNETAKANYELLDAIVDKVGAKVPEDHERPAKLDIPVTLRVVAGER